MTNRAQIRCTLPQSLLSYAGAILFVPAAALATPKLSRDPSVARKVRLAIVALLKSTQSLMLVLYADADANEHIERARLTLPDNLRCRVIGSAVGAIWDGADNPCMHWRGTFAPWLPFAVLDDGLMCDMAAVNLTRRRHRPRAEFASEICRILGIPQGPLTVIPLRSPERVKISLEAYGAGLASLAHALIKPLLTYWGLLSRSESTNFAYELMHGRSSADHYGELCRRLGIRIHAIAVTAPALHQSVESSGPLTNVEEVVHAVEKSCDQPLESLVPNPAPFQYESSSIPGYIDRIDVATGTRVTGQLVKGRFMSKAILRTHASDGHENLPRK